MGNLLKVRIMTWRNWGDELKIKEYRQIAGLTQGQFSELFEIPIDVVKSWDSGRRYPPKWVEKMLIEKLNTIIKENEA